MILHPSMFQGHFVGFHPGILGKPWSQVNNELA